MKQFRAVVVGRVQGVYFRAETAACAQRLGLGGFVRNLANGTVEVQAAGSAADLEPFIAFLRRGPEIARVDDLQIDWTAEGPLPQPFEVRY